VSRSTECSLHFSVQRMFKIREGNLFLKKDSLHVQQY